MAGHLKKRTGGGQCSISNPSVGSQPQLCGLGVRGPVWDRPPGPGAPATRAGWRVDTPWGAARWRGACSGQRRARLRARRWVALPVRPAPDLLRPGRNSGRFRVEGRSALSVPPLRPGPQRLPRGALCAPLTSGSHAFGLRVPHCRSSRRVGWGGNKVFPSWSGRGPDGEDPPSSRLHGGLDCSPLTRGHPGGSPLCRCQPPRRRMGRPVHRPLPPASPSLSPPPPLARTGPRVFGPACAGVAAVPAAAPGSLLRRPGLIPAWGAPRGERGTAREAETGALGTPALPVGEAARTPGAGTQGKARTGRPAEGRAPLIIHASHVWGHPAAFSSFSPFAFSPFPVGEGKVAVAAPCPGRSESRGRKWRTSR